MRYFLVLYSILAGLSVLLLTELANLVPSHGNPFLIFLTIIASGIFSEFLLKRHLPEGGPALIKRDRELLDGFLCAARTRHYHFPIVWGMVIAMGTSFLAMFLGCSPETFWLLFVGTAAIVFAISFILYNFVRVRDTSQVPTLSE